MVLTKPRPQLFNIDLRHYQDAADWVTAQLQDLGKTPERAVLDPYVGRWMWYDANDELVYVLRHDLMEIITSAIQKRSPATVHARQPSGNSEAVGGGGSWFDKWTTGEDDDQA